MTRTRNPVTLPTKASDLLELAVKDARAVAKRKGYRLDMLDWHVSDGRTCRVCMAGAVLANTLKLPRTQPVYFVSLGAQTNDALEAINALRMGGWPDPLGYMPDEAKPALAVISADFSRLRDGGRAKWSTYLQAAKMLRAVGL